MAFKLAAFNTNECKDLVIQTLSIKSALSPRKIHQQIREKFSVKVTYQAVHKAVRMLHNTGVLKKLENEYYLNPEWIDALYYFMSNLKEKKNTIPSTAGAAGPMDYTLALPMKAIRFVPFLLGNFTQKLPPGCKILRKDGGKIVFAWKSRLYHWYDTSICVQVTEESEIEKKIVDFLLERRKKHQNIVQLADPSAHDIQQLVNRVNPGSKPKITYVMSIHRVKTPANILETYQNNILRLCTDLSILGIVDTPTTLIGNSQIASAEKKLSALKNKDIGSTAIFETNFNNDKKVFFSWGNVIFVCSDKEYHSLLQHFQELESDLQHLWYYYYQLKNEMRKYLRTPEPKTIPKLRTMRENGYCWWDKFAGLTPATDSVAIRLRESLITTSRIEKLIREVESLYAWL